MTGRWAELRGLGGAGRDHERFEDRLEWNRLLAEHGWTCVGWPEEYGGRGLSLWQQVIFHEEYARADAPARVNHLGEELLGPTLIAFGTEEQKARFLPKIVAVEELWAQGYSEPNAGSDLANVQTKARLEDGRLGDRRAEGVDLQRASLPVGLRGRPYRAGLGAAPRTVVPAGAVGAGRRRHPADRAADRRLGVQRGLLHRCPHRRRPGRGRARPGLGGGDGAARLRARRLHACPDRRLRPRAGRPGRCRRAERRDRRSAAPRPARAAQGRARGDPGPGDARPLRGRSRRRLRRRRGSGLDLQAGLGQLAQAPG